MEAKADSVYGSIVEETDLEVKPNEALEFMINFEGITHPLQRTMNQLICGRTFADIQENGPNTL